jgi:hypothetical protein
MNWDTPIQDYYLMDGVSSNYSFDQGMRYLHNFTIFLFPAWALWLFSKKNENRIHIYLLTVLAIALLVNSGVAIYQWQMDIHFLAQGSGSAVVSARATGLLEDSGASTVFFAAMLSGVAYLLFVGTCRWPLKILWFFILAFGFFGGVASKGRIFFISLGLSLLLLLVLQIFKAIRNRSPVVILASIRLTSIFQVVNSESTSTGVALALVIAEIQEIIVCDGKITSSPSPIPKATTAISNAAVPLETAMPYFLSTLALNSNSNLSTNGPSEDTHPVSIHSLIYFFSLPPSNGVFTGIKQLFIPFF